MFSPYSSGSCCLAPAALLMLIDTGDQRQQHDRCCCLGAVARFGRYCLCSTLYCHAWHIWSACRREVAGWLLRVGSVRGSVYLQLPPVGPVARALVRAVDGGFFRCWATMCTTDSTQLRFWSLLFSSRRMSNVHIGADVLQRPSHAGSHPSHVSEVSPGFWVTPQLHAAGPVS
jgi:hypothetical protein